jgi:CubicO group peptidase (beta-lactamase class C family)
MQFIYGVGVLIAVAVAVVVLRWGVPIVWLIIRAIREVRAFERLTNSYDLQARIDHMAAEYVAARPHARLVIAICQHGRHRVLGYGTPPTPDLSSHDGQRIYEIGSVTKVLTGILLARLELAGVLKLDDPITKYLPESVAVPTPVQNITLRHLATHTSGLPRLPDNLDATVTNEANPYANYGVADLYQYLRHAVLEHPPGHSCDYSNLGMGLLGHLLERAADRPYATLIQETITAPLKMSDTAITLNVEQQVRRMPGHTPTGASTSHWDLNVLAPAGGVLSTADDLIKFLAANLCADDAPPLHGALAYAQKVHWGEGLRPGPAAGLGWCIDRTMMKNQLIHWHNGGTGGFVSFIGLVKEHQVAVALLSNSGDALIGDDSLDWLGFGMLRMATKVSLEN